MNALAIDCAVSRITISARKELHTVKLTLDIGNRQSEKLLPSIDFVLKEIGLTARELDYTAVTLGPGTFTGLRLGLSALKAINLAYNVPCYGIPSLQAYAWPYGSSKETVLSLIEAKEDEYFFSFFSSGKEISEEEDCTMDELLKRIDSESTILACGPGARYFTERTGETAPLYSVHCFSPENDCTESLFEMAEVKIKAGEAPLADYDGPLYIRKSEAEIVLEKKQQEEAGK